MNSKMALYLEQAKEEYVNEINKVTQKYGLSYYFVEILLGGIYAQVTQLKQQEIEQEFINYQEEQKKQQEESKKKKGSEK